jgi:hypothetical protein
VPAGQRQKLEASSNAHQSHRANGVVVWLRDDLPESRLDLPEHLASVALKMKRAKAGMP